MVGKKQGQAVLIKSDETERGTLTQTIKYIPNLARLPCYEDFCFALSRKGTIHSVSKIISSVAYEFDSQNAFKPTFRLKIREPGYVDRKSSQLAIHFFQTIYSYTQSVQTFCTYLSSYSSASEPRD